MTCSAVLTMIAGSAWFAPLAIAIGLSMMALAALADRRG